jgi:hypothetical protein
MTVIPFVPEHLVEMTMQDNPDNTGNLDRDTLLRKAQEKLNGPAITLIDDENRIVMCGGIINIWQGVGEAWSVSSTIAARYPKSILSTARKFIGRCSEYHRIQAIVIDGFIRAEKLLAHLGFEREGTMRKYSASGQDYKLFSIVR